MGRPDTKPNLPKYCFNCLQPKPCSCVGRPSKVDPTILAKLQQGFSNGLTDEEACNYAGIHPATLYRFQEENPEFCEQKKQWKLNPSLIARKTILVSLSDPQYAWRYLERKDPELKPVSKLEHAGKIQTEDTTEISPDEKADIAEWQAIRAKRRKEARSKMA